MLMGRHECFPNIVLLFLLLLGFFVCVFFFVVVVFLFVFFFGGGNTVIVSVSAIQLLRTKITVAMHVLYTMTTTDTN